MSDQPECWFVCVWQVPVIPRDAQVLHPEPHPWNVLRQPLLRRSQRRQLPALPAAGTKPQTNPRPWWNIPNATAHAGPPAHLRRWSGQLDRRDRSAWRWPSSTRWFPSQPWWHHRSVLFPLQCGPQVMKGCAWSWSWSWLDTLTLSVTGPLLAHHVNRIGIAQVIFRNQMLKNS